MAALASCGGNTRDDDGNPAASGGQSSGAGSSGSSGSGGRGGGTGGVTSGSAGTARVSTGGTSAVGGSGSGVGRPALCSLPPLSGSCNAYFEKYYFDAIGGSCEEFVYTGCGGNANQFDTLEQCQATCGGVTDLTACSDNTDCMLVAGSCCGACEPSELSEFVAINAEREADWLGMRACTDVLCEPCLAPDRETATSPYFVATCEAGRCVAVDLGAIGSRDCQTDADCQLRNGASCCEACTDFAASVIALSDTSSLTTLVCSELEVVACPDCDTLPPEGYAGVCDAGQCRVDVVD